MIEYTIELMKIAREAIIELTVAIRIEEYRRHGENKAVSVPVYSYDDDFRR